jgi:hypothetical protein
VRSVFVCCRSSGSLKPVVAEIGMGEGSRPVSATAALNAI